MAHARMHFGQAGADPISVLFFTSGASLLISQFFLSAGQCSLRRSLAAGLLFGMAGLTRYHALIGGVLFLGALLAAKPGSWRAVACAGAGLLAAYAPQLIVNALTGHGPLETGYGNLNVYDLMYELSWGVRFVVVNDRGRSQAPFFGELYDGTMLPRNVLELIGRFADQAVFMVL